MFRKLIFFIFSLLIVTALSIQNVWAAKKVINWNYHTSYDKSYYVGGSHIQQWADRVWKETNHQLKINIFYNGGLGYKGTEIMSSLRDGLLQSAEFAASLYGAEANQKWWSFNDFLSIYDNWDQLVAVDKVAYPMMWQDIINFKGVKPLALFPCCPKDSFQGIWMNEKIEKWSDFKGKKLRIWYAKARKYVLDPLGFETVYLSGPETYQGLKSGLIDGIIQTPTSGLSAHYDEIAKYFYACVPVTVSWWGIICSQKAFDSLPKDVQEGLVRASKEHEKFLNDSVWLHQCKYTPGAGGSPYCVKDAIKKLKERGNVVVRVPLLTKKLKDQAMIGMKQWVDTEGGPKAKLLFETLLKAKKQYPNPDTATFSSLKVWHIEDK
jgi:TRAP-type C4-dicarboxylate transport system substrate-binding protein